MIQWVEGWITRIKGVFAQPLPVNNPIHSILSLISLSPKFGVKTYAMWLGNSQAKVLERKSLNKHFRSKLAQYSIANIVQEIERIIRNGWANVIEVGRHDLPVLILTPQGKKFLESLRKGVATSGEASLPAKESPHLVDFYSQLSRMPGMGTGRHG
jgi:hypothetical protein